MDRELYEQAIKRTAAAAAQLITPKLGTEKGEEFVNIMMITCHMANQAGISHQEFDQMLALIREAQQRMAAPGATAEAPSPSEPTSEKAEP